MLAANHQAKVENRVVVKLAGNIDEKMNYAGIFPQGANHVEFLCDSVVRINSTGLRLWLGILREHEAAGESFRLHWVPASVASLILLLAPALASARVSSVQVVLCCEGCKKSHLGLVRVAEGLKELDRLRSIKCGCGGRLQFDEGHEEMESVADLLMRAGCTIRGIK